MHSQDMGERQSWRAWAGTAGRAVIAPSLPLHLAQVHFALVPSATFARFPVLLFLLFRLRMDSLFLESPVTGFRVLLVLTMG